MGDGIVSRVAETEGLNASDDGEKARQILVMPRTTAQVSAILRALDRHGVRLHSARRRHRTLGRIAAAERAGDDLHLEDEPDRLDRPGQPALRRSKAVSSILVTNAFNHHHLIQAAYGRNGLRQSVKNSPLVKDRRLGGV